MQGGPNRCTLDLTVRTDRRGTTPVWKEILLLVELFVETIRTLQVKRLEKRIQALEKQVAINRSKLDEQKKVQSKSSER